MGLDSQLSFKGLAAGSSLPLGNGLVLPLVLTGGGLSGALVGFDAVGSLHFSVGRLP